MGDGRRWGSPIHSEIADASGVVLLTSQSADTARISDATSRAIQGILTGIGFLGAGVIVHGDRHFRIRGSTPLVTAGFVKRVSP